jgi:c-di-GMP-binding flagellar brake protein YcgR
MENKRRYERFSVDFMDIHGKILFSTNIKVLNISIDGISFSTDKCLTKGGVYVLKLETKGSILYLEGTILWSKVNKNIQKDGDVIRTYTLGMKFLHASDTQRREIEKFIKDNYLAYQKIETFTPVISSIRIHVRFHINDPDKATIDCAEHYKVKRISQSGMLIESANLFQIEDRVPMHMRLSEEKNIAFWARIVTCQAIQNAEQQHYELGIEFIDMSQTDRTLLKAFITSLEEKI